MLDGIDPVDPSLPAKPSRFVITLSGATGAITSVQSQESEWTELRDINMPADGFPLLNSTVGKSDRLMRLSPQGDAVGPGTWIRDGLGIYDFAAAEPSAIAAITQAPGFKYALSILDRATGLPRSRQEMAVLHFALAAGGDRIVALCNMPGLPFDPLEPGPCVDATNLMERQAVSRWTPDGAFHGTVPLPVEIFPTAIAADEQGATYIAAQAGPKLNKQIPFSLDPYTAPLTVPENGSYLMILKFAP